MTATGGGTAGIAFGTTGSMSVTISGSQVIVGTATIGGGILFMSSYNDAHEMFNEIYETIEEARTEMQFLYSRGQQMRQRYKDLAKAIEELEAMAKEIAEMFGLG